MSGIVYMIKCNETAECYIGSTNSSINKRMTSHKTNMNRYVRGNTVIKKVCFLYKLTYIHHSIHLYCLRMCPELPIFLEIKKKKKYFLIT